MNTKIFELERLIEAFLNTPPDEDFVEDTKKYLNRGDPVKSVARQKVYKPGARKRLPSDILLDRIFRRLKKKSFIENKRSALIFCLEKMLSGVNSYAFEENKKTKYILAEPNRLVIGPYGPDTIAVEYLLPTIKEQMEIPEKKEMILRILHKLGFKTLDELKEKGPERADRFCTKAVLSLYEKAKIPAHPKHTARAFETKRNIPLKMNRKMEYSPFKKYFEFVEYDSTTDLVKVNEVFKDFQAICLEFFAGKKAEGIKLRFRYLGRHRAAGLYYPDVKCMSIDVRHPDSFIHEYFHMTDFQNGKLSETEDFAPIRAKYEELVNRLHGAMDAEAKIRLKNSKYNLAYYLQPTEIFARCGEIYIQRICEVSNSCVKHSSEKDFAYPEDKELNKLIREYYEKILPERKTKPEERPA